MSILSYLHAHITFLGQVNNSIVSRPHTLYLLLPLLLPATLGGEGQLLAFEVSVQI